MRYLAVVPLLIAALFALAVGVRPSEPLYRVAIEGAKVVALLGCWIAALSFEPTDYMRRAWGMTGACMFLLLVRDVTVVPAVGAVFGPLLPKLQSGLVLAANLCSVIGTWLMARAWHVAGLDPPNRRAPIVLGIGVALLIAGGAVMVDARAIANGNHQAIVPLASDLGDVISLSLIAPVVMTALAMRGGTLRWPWGLFAVSLLCWLFYDATNALRAIWPSLRWLNETFRILACTYLCAAGLAQREAVK